jgi:hypothetical protein
MSAAADAAGIIAPAATMLAAMMTAANLGARVTGWGFVVFTLGSLSWSVVAIASGQTNLLATNVFLTLVNLIGIWRWLGRQKAYEDGAEAAAAKSRTPGVPSLFSATGLSGMPVSDVRGEVVGKSVEAMIECETGQVSYIVIASGGVAGVDETLRSVPMAAIDCHADGLILLETMAEFERRDALAPEDWPGAAPAAAARARRQVNVGAATSQAMKHAPA